LAVVCRCRQRALVARSLTVFRWVVAGKLSSRTVPVNPPGVVFWEREFRFSLLGGMRRERARQRGVVATQQGCSARVNLPCGASGGVGGLCCWNSLRGRAFVRLVPHVKAVSSQGGPFPLLRNQRGQGQGSSALPVRHQGVTCGRAIKMFPQASAFPATRRVCFERGVVPRPCRAGLESPRGVGDGPDGSSGLGRLSG
jgi:hypothetical protein